MSDTLKTDMAARKIGAAAARWKNDTITAIAFADALDRFADTVAELERENVALRADKERLDWLALSPDKRLLTVHGLWVNDGDVADMRAAIDAARKVQP
jgi:hypothetical protein